MRGALAQAVRAVASGRRFIDGEAAIEWMQSRTGEELKAREVQVLELVAAGKANKQIAFELSTTEGTVKNYISTILAKTGLRDRTQAALYAVRRGLA